MNRIAAIDVVGLCRRVLGAATPRMEAYRREHSLRSIRPAFPAVTCTAQSNYLTGRTPSVHGITGNGWYDRELAEVHFWKQPDHLVRSEKVWEMLRRERSDYTCAKLFWWYNMYSSADWSVTPRPMYPADGRKILDIYAHPACLGTKLKEALGAFPFPAFWGPAAGRSTPRGAPDEVSRWIAASARRVEEEHRPDLNLIYLPHLDYNLQRLGPDHPEVREDHRRIDAIVGDLIDFFAARGVLVLLLSEYGITPVRRPVHINRAFRRKGWIAVREELGRELLDCGASRAFAVADHQVAHVHVRRRELTGTVRRLLEGMEGVAQVMDAAAQEEAGIRHERAGDLVAVAEDDSWFTYYYWLEEDRAPDFARCVDIHRKPGYDPVELFIDPALRLPELRILWRLVRKRLGFRMLMDVIPLDATLVRGSHGNRPGDVRDWPVMIGPSTASARQEELDSTEVCEAIRSLAMG